MKQCLVVAESRVIRRVACKLLEEMKFHTEESDEGTDALETCRTQMPDAVLIDIGNTSGVELLRALRREKADRRPLIVFTTLENDIVQISEALSAGADQYLLKPFDRETMRSTFCEAGLAA